MPANPESSCTINHTLKNTTAGRSTIQGMMMMGMSVVTLALGNSRKYPPMTPAMAPDAPMTGTGALQLKTTCTAAAATPHRI